MIRSLGSRDGSDLLSRINFPNSWSYSLGRKALSRGRLHYYIPEERGKEDDNGLFN